MNIHLKALLLLLVLHSAPLSADSASSRKIAQKVKIVVEKSQDNLVVRYSFQHSVKAVVFRTEAERYPLFDNWKTVSSDWRWLGNSIARVDGRNFEEFELWLSPDKRSSLKAYPTSWVLGDNGLVVNPANLIPIIEEEVEAEFWIEHGDCLYSAATPTGNCHRKQSVVIGTEKSDFIYIGKLKPVSAGPFTFVYDEGFPPWLREAITETAEIERDRLTQGLGEIGQDTTLVLMSHSLAGGATWVGDKTSTGSIGLRFYGTKWAKENAELEAVVRKFVSHEFFHLWNSGLYRPKFGSDYPWLHEGMAEFYALLSASPDKNFFLHAIADNVNQCVMSLQGRSFQEFSLNANRALYPCGTTFFWLWAHLEQEDRYQGWLPEFLKRLDEILVVNEDYTPALFLDELAGRAPDVFALLVSIVKENDANKWKRLADLLSAQNGPIQLLQNEETIHKRLRQLLIHLVTRQCPNGPGGFLYTETTFTPDRPLSCLGQQQAYALDRINGQKVFQSIQSVIDSIETSCLTGQAVEAGVANSDEAVSLKCNLPLPDPYLSFGVETE